MTFLGSLKAVWGLASQWVVPEPAASVGGTKGLVGKIADTLARTKSHFILHYHKQFFLKDNSLTKVFDEAVKIINAKFQPLNTHLFNILCDDMRSKH